MPITGLLALTVASIFTGAAFYVGFAEQPARLLLDDRSLLAEWKPSYKRGFLMQASLAVVGFVFGVAAWWSSGNILWLLGAATLIANWPYTVLVIMPTNNALNATALTAAGPATRGLVMTWGRLHAVRTSLGAVSTVLFLWAAM
jgi:anthrone oxygenase-like protein